MRTQFVEELHQNESHSRRSSARRHGSKRNRTTPITRDETGCA